MSKGYPSRVRARHAFERGVRDGFARRACRNPYLNEWMIDLYARGHALGKSGREPAVPLAAKVSLTPAPRHGGKKRPRHEQPHRPQHRPHRSFSNPPRRNGGWR